MNSTTFRQTSVLLRTGLRLSQFYHSPSTLSFRLRAVAPTRDPFTDRSAYLRLLKSSSALPSHHLGFSIHAHILKTGFQREVIIATALIGMRCGFADIDGARKLFDQMPERDVAAWNAMLSGFIKNGHVEQALSFFRLMGSDGAEPNSLTLSALLQVSSCVEDRKLGRSIHGYVVRHPELENAFFGNSLLVYYNRVGECHISERIFEGMLIRDIVSWNAMISGYAKNGVPWRAVEMFCLLREEGLDLDIVTIETALQACAQIGKDAQFVGQSIHTFLVKLGFHMDVYAQNCLLLMYCKCGIMDYGQCLFDTMEVRNLVSWNVIVSGYIQKKCPQNVISLFKCKRCVDLEMSSDLLVSVLQAVKLMGGCAKWVMSVHCFVIVMGFEPDVFVSSSLIAAYGNSGEIESAHRCLDGMLSKCTAIVCWNTMLSVYLHHGYFSEAVELLGSMRLKGCTFDAATLVSVLSLCTHQLDLELGRVVHGYIMRNKFESDVFVTASLLEMYSKCGCLDFACLLFSKMRHRNIVSWNTMIHGCLQNGFHSVSLKLFHLMLRKDGFMPDATTVVGVIEAISHRGYLRERNYIHEYVICEGFIDDEYVVNSLIALHARFHDFGKARVVFDKSSKLSVATWNTMISEYSYSNLVDDALSVFYLMKLNDVAPDSVTLLCLLRACAVSCLLSCIMWIHAIICKTAYESDVYVGTSLMDAYAKCGDLSIARLVFDMLKSKTVVTWNSMIQGYGIHGNVEESNRLFSQMQQSGLTPNMITFLILISSCSHSGDMEKGQYYFNLMTQVFSLFPGSEHFSCYIDLLGRTGHVNEAYECLKNIPSDLGVYAWGSLLGACRLQGDLEVGVAVSQKLFQLDPLNFGYYSLLWNMFAESGKSIDASYVRSKVDEMGFQKEQGWSIIESFS